VCLTHQSSGSGTTGLSDAAISKDLNAKFEARRLPGGFRHKCQACAKVGFKRKVIWKDMNCMLDSRY
jgi:hypothetical protein